MKRISPNTASTRKPTPSTPEKLPGNATVDSGDNRARTDNASVAASEVIVSNLHKAGLVNRAFRALRSFPWSVLISGIALVVSIYSTRYATLGMKAGQRAYISYQITVDNPEAVIDSVAKDRDFFLAYQVTVTNIGNTPAESVTPKIDVVSDPDRHPVMITFPSLQQFDLGPKESRILKGQALFHHLRNVRKLPGFSTGLSGQIEYKDVFGDSGTKSVCYQLIFQNALNGGFCGDVIQQLEVREMK